jgi:hypothetical protein
MSEILTLKDSVVTLGIDIAKKVFYLVDFNELGKKVFVAKLTRDEMLPFFIHNSDLCKQIIITMEACSGSN